MRIADKPARSRIAVLVLAVVLAAAVAGTAVVIGSAPGYRVRLVLPSAAGVFDGQQVRIDNLPVGQVREVTVENGKAVLEVEIDDEHAPLRRGVEPVITQRSLLGESYLQLHPGTGDGPALPSGSEIETGWSQVSIEDVIESLDAPTRERLRSLIGQAAATLDGHEPDVNATLRELGPVTAALGQVLAAVAEDGPALRELVIRLDTMLTAVASRRAELSAAVSDLAAIADTLAAQRHSVRESLHELPPTLRQAQGTLGRIPGAVRAARPLLADLRPVTARLPDLAADLGPVVADLRPVAADLRATLESADELLARTPALLDGAHAVLPQTTRALDGLAPALAFLRPYTPDLVGFLSNWAGAFGGYDEAGHRGHLLLTVSGISLNGNPGVVPPGLTLDHTTAPGTAAGQPWTDAGGDPVR